ncbi:YopX family protein [Macrococcoides bohemicum]|uniref:YopX family protein n=1 Tax=Macrococcoides bohemicum TaxID=1903056 RepID=UPI00289E6D91|nr:YopX family protein [Macrococcus bohemicus]
MIPKFRLFDKVDRQMRVVHVIDMYLNEITCYEPNNHDYTHEDTYHYEEESLKGVILMQSTGLHDVNGKEIYEGDILEIAYDDIHGEANVYDVVAKSPFDYSLTEANWLNHSYQIEIIGNIHEHSHLLEK